MQLDDAVDGFGAAVGGPVGGEVAQVGVLPLAQGAAQAGDIGDRACREGGQDLFGAATQQVADPEQGVPGVAAVAQGVLLDAAADLVGDLDGEPTTWNASSTGTA